jgi:hypothetical protein
MRLSILGFALALSAVTTAAATDITTCGQTILARDTGVLVADLDCPSSAGAVFLGEKATFDLAGYTLTGGQVQCTGSCTVRGGTIVGVPSAAIYAGLGYGRKFIGEDLDLHDNDVGLVAQARTVILTNVNASNNVEDGIETFSATRIRGTGVTASSNGSTGLDVQNRGSVLITGLTATGNGWGGVINDGRRTRLVDSTVTGNAWPPFPGEPTMIDIAGPCPKLLNTTCDHSYPNCGVCGQD